MPKRLIPMPIDEHEILARRINKLASFAGTLKRKADNLYDAYPELMRDYRFRTLWTLASEVASAASEFDRFYVRKLRETE